MGKEKVQFTLTFYLKQNKELQLDLQRFVIFMFSSLLSSLPLGKMVRRKVNVPIFVIWNMWEWEGGRVNIIQFHSILVSFGSMYFFNLKS